MEMDQQIRAEMSRDDIDRLVERLDLSRFLEAGLVITGAELWGERIRLSMSWTGVGDQVVVIRRADDQPSFMSTARLAFSLSGSSVSRPWRILIGRMALAVGDADIDELSEPVAASITTSRPDVADSPIKSWSVEGSWGRFFCDHAMARKFYEAMQFESSATFLVHGDLECKFITPRFRSTLPRFFNYPWKIFGDSEGEDPLTDLSDRDVIFGGEETLEYHIEKLLANRRRPGPFIVNSTCVPVVIGDDVEKILARFDGRCDGGMYHVSPLTGDPMEIIMQYLDDARDRAVREASVDQGSIALVGFRSGRTHNEITRLIGDCGITLKGTILPRASADLMEKVMTAEVLVFRPSIHLVDLYERVFRGCGLKKISPPPPFGFSGTSSWLMQIAAASGREEHASEVIGRFMEANSAELASLKAGAAMHEITFVVETSELSRLTDPESSTGLAVLPVVAELGYCVRVLGNATVPSAFRDFSDRLKSWAAAAGVELTVDGFTSESELSDAIAAGGGGAVFSEFFYDYRISRAGLPQISARDFEMGLEGALRNARRLSRLFDTPWYGRYAALANLPGGSGNWWKA